MKKRISILLIITLIFQLTINIISNTSLATSNNKTKTVKRNSESYWSTSNAPLFYGTTKITIKKGIIDEFDVLDSRFRIFARDFEDGDLTSKIKHSGEVNINEANTYEITYTVTDSHNNTSSLIVPVVVTDDENEKITVERTLYTTPSVWNMDLAEFSRCNYGDRQILGIFLKANQSVEARIISSEYNLNINFMNNDSYTESSLTLPKTGEWITLKNTKNGINYDSVPLVKTQVLTKSNTKINKTYKIELKYDETISPLNYYHYLDNEDNFRQKWTKTLNSYAVIESETLLLVVPFTDMKYMTNYYANGFKSLDKFLEYYQKVIETMDEYIGLDFNPLKLTDQNVRTKYLIKANVHGIGAAYYAGDHVGVNNSSMASFFEMNWGGLHELAHGYQGSFGKGEMLLGEVANNILGYYIQIDKNIYYHPGNWLGEIPAIEENKNAERLSGKGFLEVDEPTRLYILINLFDSFDGASTYAKMFSWYREQLNKGRTMTNQDAYVESIADIYNINIIPYMDAWRLNISNSVRAKLYESNYPMINILADMVDSNNLTKIMNSEGINRKYSLVKNEIIKKYNIFSNASLNINIDDFSKIQGKIILLKDGKQTTKSIKINNNLVELSNIPVGNYYLQMPIINEYSQEHMYIQIKENNNKSYIYNYENLESTDYKNYIKLQVLGYNYDTIAFQLLFKDNYTRAEISYPNQSKMSGNESVIIYNAEGSTISKYTTTGNYFDFDKGTHEILLQPGYKIEITYPVKFKTKVLAYNTLLNNIVPEYGGLNATTTYTVIDNGLLREDMDEDIANDLAYNSLKSYLVNIINDYQTRVTDTELNNKNINFSEKASIIDAYNQLKDEDKTPYTDLINRIKQGGIPIITINTNIFDYEVGSKIDLLSLVSVIDNEDGVIEINDSNVITNLNVDIPGTYDVTYEIKDSDNNISIYSLQINIIGNLSDEDEEEILPPEEENNPEDTVIPPSDDTEEDNTKDDLLPPSYDNIMEELPSTSMDENLSNNINESNNIVVIDEEILTADSIIPHEEEDIINISEEEKNTIDLDELSEESTVLDSENLENENIHSENHDTAELKHSNNIIFLLIGITILILIIVIIIKKKM